MAKRFTIEVLMDLAKSIGANPNKFMGTKTNITFLGTGPTKNPLFQRPLPGLDRAGINQLGSRDALIEATEDAMSYLSSGKLNTIQTEILGKNLTGIKNILEPPPLPTASVTPIRSGIATLKGNDIGAGPRRYNELTGLNRPRWDFRSNIRKERRRLKDLEQSRLPEPGPGDIQAFSGALNMQTGMSRAIARNLLLKDSRLSLEPKDLFMLKEGKGEPLDLMKKYYGESMLKYDDFLNSVNLEAARPDEFAEMILKNVELIPAFAHGGLAKILEV